jgi:hypothetical protein
LENRSRSEAIFFSAVLETWSKSDFIEETFWYTLISVLY